MEKKLPGTLGHATRVGLGVLSALLLIALVNDVFGLGLIGQHSRQLLILLGVFMFGVLYKVGVFLPQAESTAQESSVTTSQKNQALILVWLWCLAIGLVPVVILGPRIYRGEPIKILDWLVLAVFLMVMIRRWRRDRKPR